jgi:hypothetical protein
VEEFDPPDLRMGFVTFRDAASPVEGARVRFTCPAKAFRLVNVTLAVPELVALMITVVGADDMVKSGAGMMR